MNHEKSGPSVNTNSFPNLQEPADHPSSSKTSCKSITMEDLPGEVLEHIFGFLSPYRELDTAKLVCRLWNFIINSLVRQQKRKFYQSLSKCDISWTFVASESQAVHSDRVIKGISERFSHCSVYYNGSMYVFGGCTSTNTTFNDLWRLDLTSRKWVRPMATGTYPSPKACATMVEYNGNLVLFGGWSHPIPYPLHQSAHYFSELHVYNTVTNEWSRVYSLGQEPEALGGHSASVAGHLMVIFGGSPRPGMGTNKLWVFNFFKASWSLQQVSSGAEPEPRYGQFQTTLDDTHILIVGGCVEQNRVFNDLWLLTLHKTEPWQWTKLTIRHPELAAPQTWCHAACRVKDTIVVIARSSKVRQTRNLRVDMLRRAAHRASLLKQGSSSSNTAGNVSVTREPYQLDHSPRQEARQHGSLHNEQQQQSGSQSSSPEFEVSVGGSESVVHPGSSSTQESHGHGLNLSAHEPQQLHSQQSHVSEEALFPATSSSLEGESSRQLGASSPAGLEPTTRQSSPRAVPLNVDQPQFGSLSRASSNLAGLGRARGGGGMPSVRPNAMNNRQKQLEALQRQEEIIRSKSRALAAARVLPHSANNTDERLREEEIPEPELIPSRNRMDAHLLDISQVLTNGEAEWKPLSELQPSGAPKETICCSLLEGRGELMLFGGVVRTLGSPVMTSTAVNKLYILQPS